MKSSSTGQTISANQFHVFIGAGSANTDLAMRIKKVDPLAQIVIIDHRLEPTSEKMLQNPRKNIYRLPDSFIDDLIEHGVSVADLKASTYRRPFSVMQGFQEGDQNVFSSTPFTTLEIGVQQKLAITAMMKSDVKPLLLVKKVNTDTAESILHDVESVLNESGLIKSARNHKISIHVATGVIKQDDDTNSQIVYPLRSNYSKKSDTVDVKSMPIAVPHGTATFAFELPMSCDKLMLSQRSLDLTDWNSLKKLGWMLIRPPRVRIFYVPGTLYIGTEIPAAMYDLEDESFKPKMTEFAREIAHLVFPSININKFQSNITSSSRFRVSRSESGKTIYHSNKAMVGAPGSVVDIYYRGDERYAPHYQTGSGIVTASLINELFVDIYYKCNNFSELLEFYKKSEPEAILTQDEMSLRLAYLKLNSYNEKLSLEAAKAELFLQLSNKIIRENQVKVSKYFTALHQQELDSLEDRLVQIVNIYNHYHTKKLKLDQVLGQGIDPALAVINLLVTDNIQYLRAISPLLINRSDLQHLSTEKLLEEHKDHLLDYLDIIFNNYSRLDKDSLSDYHGFLTKPVSNRLSKNTVSNKFFTNLQSLLYLGEDATMHAIKELSVYLKKFVMKNSITTVFFGDANGPVINTFVNDIASLSGASDAGLAIINLLHCFHEVQKINSNELMSILADKILPEKNTVGASLTL